MTSNQDSSSTQPQASKNVYEKKFSDEFQQLFSVEISKGLWINAYKSKSTTDGMFVDVRRKLEGTKNGRKFHIPLKQGLFLKYPEYEALKTKFDIFLYGRDKSFEVSSIPERTLIGNAIDGGATLEIKLKTEYKESNLTLSRAEIEKLISDPVSDGIAAAVCKAIYG